MTKISLNPQVIKAEYAVRGELALRAEELRQRLDSGDTTLPFHKVINCNIGNPQQLGQPPITFFRKVLSLIECPQLMGEDGEHGGGGCFKNDVKDRAKALLHMIGSTGAYSHSKGVLGIRKEVAHFLGKRDGFPADPEAIFLTNGASEGINRVLTLFSRGPNVGVLIPIPQYPLYAATITLLNATIVPYYLCEELEWNLTIQQLESAINQSPVKPTILCVINPGNPTGNCLSAKCVEQILQVALKHNLILLFDEVYQENWYDERCKFVSARKVLLNLPSISPSLHLFSFHSCSKGLIGECGKRGGFMHYEGSSQEIKDNLYKLASISLCPNIQGQVLVRSNNLLMSKLD